MVDGLWGTKDGMVVATFEQSNLWAIHIGNMKYSNEIQRGSIKILKGYIMILMIFENLRSPYTFYLERIPILLIVRLTIHERYC